MLELWTTITVECAHSMPAALGVPAVHGHSYWLQFFVKTSVEDPVPLPSLQFAADCIRRQLDHRNLDELMPAASMEAIAQFAADRWYGPRLTRVVVRRDSLGCGVEWRP